MRALIVIPARYASVRYPGKPLVSLRDGTGAAKSLIQRTHEAACAVRGPEDVVIATDDPRIHDHAKTFGARVVMTSPTCRNGTERCAEVLAQLADPPDVVVNFQGDAPLTPPWFVEHLLDAMQADGAVQMATPVLPCDADMLQNLLDDRRNGRVGATTAVFDHAMNALYFSKEVLPFGAPDAEPDGAAGGTAAPQPVQVFHHVGVYAFRRAALAAYGSWPMGPLERAERLEQLRFLEQGCPVRCVPVDARGKVFWELNHPVDVARIEAALGAPLQAPSIGP